MNGINPPLLLTWLHHSLLITITESSDTVKTHRNIRYIFCNDLNNSYRDNLVSLRQKLNLTAACSRKNKNNVSRKFLILIDFPSNCLMILFRKKNCNSINHTPFVSGCFIMFLRRSHTKHSNLTFNLFFWGKSPTNISLRLETSKRLSGLPCLVLESI